MRSSTVQQRIDARAAANRIRAWGEACDWRGWDPYDGLTSPAAPLLTLGRPFGRRLLTQTVKASPVNLRPLLRIRRAWNQKAIGLVASGYVHLATAGDAQARAAADRWLDWLESSGAGRRGAWSYPFDVQTRFFFYPAGSANTIATAFVAHAFLDAFEAFGDERRLHPALDASGFYLETMLADGKYGPFFRYVPDDGKLIHNANLLACSVVARAGRLVGDRSLEAAVAPAVATSVDLQRADGSWPYSEWAGQEWVDNFHTGYVLESLAACSGLPRVEQALARGVAYWRRELFLPDGTPKYRPDRAEPLDAHCYAQAVDTNLAVDDDAGLGEAERGAALLVHDMLRPDGAVAFQRRGTRVHAVPFVRWTAAPSFRCLARLAARQRG